ncbi:hypothetical protein BJF92_11160 [Rhizobium rhizosphaerae]|uniref:Uncharacterized protein n=1 Tax=Xaviernesmea rhizosphaerae TaxID=1672749 RepID=A0A1Q9AMM5_9HYPH|nr:hypothetical protein [Xaviernesmea rhizosphaerae]OLP56642.1 hypothetical protein BJF92_11160 [Xaviernesmea rhizosphaerae]
MTTALRSILPDEHETARLAALATQERWIDFSRGLVCGVAIVLPLALLPHALGALALVLR